MWLHQLGGRKHHNKQPKSALAYRRKLAWTPLSLRWKSCMLWKRTYFLVQRRQINVTSVNSVVVSAWHGYRAMRTLITLLTKSASATVAEGGIYTRRNKLPGRNKLSVHLRIPTEELIHRKSMHNISVCKASLWARDASTDPRLQTHLKDTLVSEFIPLVSLTAGTACTAPVWGLSELVDSPAPSY